MRPFAVFLLVVAAVVALTFAYKSLGSGEAPDPAAPTVNPAEGPTPGDPAELVQAPGDATTRIQTPAGDHRVEVTGFEQDDSTGYSNTLVGYVFNDAREPVEGAVVNLSAKAMMGEEVGLEFFMMGSGKPKPAWKKTTETDSEGLYEFKNIKPRRNYYLMASHPGYSSKQESYVRVGDRGQFNGPEIELKVGSACDGYVSDVGNNPVPDAWVHLDSAYMLGTTFESEDRLSTQTDPSGYFEFKNVAAGPRNVSVQADGYGIQVKTGQMFSGESNDRVTLNFRLEIGHPIGGRVSGPQGEPVAAARILAFNHGSNTNSRGEALTDDEGAFLIQGLQNGTYILMVEAEGYRAGRMNRVQTGDMGVQIDMIARAAVTGRVLGQGGNPLSDFSCSVLRMNLNSGTVSEKIMERDFRGETNGEYVMSGLDPGEYVVLADAKGYAPSVSGSFKVAESETVGNVTVQMGQGGTLRGRVLDSAGKPIAGAAVSSHDNDHVEDRFSIFSSVWISSHATQRRARTRADGSFEIALLTPETYMVLVDSPNYTREFLNDQMVNEGGVTEVGDITLLAGGTITGTVVDPSGQPLGNGYVHLRHGEELNSNYYTRTDGQGRYTLLHVRPGAYRLSASGISPSDGGQAFKVVIDQKSSEIPVTIIDGKEIRQDLHLGG